MIVRADGATLQEKDQAPSTKHQRSSKYQAPKAAAGFWTVAVDIGSRTSAMTKSKFRSESLELGCFHVLTPSACPDGGIVMDTSFGVVLTFQRSLISVT